MGNSFLASPKTEKSCEEGENERLRYSVCSMQGWRTEMEDSHISILSDQHGVSLFGVFDGHCGDEVAIFVATKLHEIITSLKTYPHDLEASLRRSFFALDEDLLDSKKYSEFLTYLQVRNTLENGKKRTRPVAFSDRESLQREVRQRMDEANSKGSLSRDDALHLAKIMAKLESRETVVAQRPPSGCTAICAALKGNKLVVANAGDSRGVLCRKGGVVVPLSEDHKPDKAIERNRIVNAGGHVHDNRVNGQLALSRAIGDFDFKKNDDLPPEQQQVTCSPDVLTVDIEEGDEFFMLACDGIWDVLSNEAAVKFVREQLQQGFPINEVVSKLFDRCLAPTCDDLGTDNMTCIIVQFK